MIAEFRFDSFIELAIDPVDVETLIWQFVEWFEKLFSRWLNGLVETFLST